MKIWSHSVNGKSKVYKKIITVLFSDDREIMFIGKVFDDTKGEYKNEIAFLKRSIEEFEELLKIGNLYNDGIWVDEEDFKEIFTFIISSIFTIKTEA